MKNTADNFTRNIWAGIGLIVLIFMSMSVYSQPAHNEWRVSSVSCDSSKITAALNALTSQQAREAKIVAIPFGGSISNCEHVEIGRAHV